MMNTNEDKNEFQEQIQRTLKIGCISGGYTSRNLQNNLSHHHTIRLPFFFISWTENETKYTKQCPISTNQMLYSSYPAKQPLIVKEESPLCVISPNFLVNPCFASELPSRITLLKTVECWRKIYLCLLKVLISGCASCNPLMFWKFTLLWFRIVIDVWNSWNRFPSCK